MLACVCLCECVRESEAALYTRGSQSRSFFYFDWYRGTVFFGVSPSLHPSPLPSPPLLVLAHSTQPSATCSHAPFTSFVCSVRFDVCEKIPFGSNGTEAVATFLVRGWGSGKYAVRNVYLNLVTASQP